ncbi:MAG TPA: hypothetical protein VKX17_02610 [Planctomycetota bacterium]|nr:hypothetical protein [Planctomycetota bacterium]
MYAKCFATLVLIAALHAICGDAAPAMKQESASGITHAFLVCGNETYIVSKDGKVTWTYPGATRDGWATRNGVLLAVSKCKEFPGGGVVFIAKGTNEKECIFKGTQDEVHSVEVIDKKDGENVMLTEGGPKPRLLEVNQEGKIEVEFPLQCQIPNSHMQTRMARKLPNGNYLVPHLLDFAVKEYKPDGTVVNVIKTPDDPKESWPFTAIRLANGNTLITCTHGNHVIETDAQGKIVWQLTNKDLPEPLLSDPCGAQRLSNGNTVIASYGATKADAVKMFEVTADKKVVWTFKSGKAHGVHEFHIFENDEMGK